MAESLVVRSQIKKLIGELNLAGDFTPTLNAKVEELINKAIERAKANKRKTIMGKDV